MIHSGCPHQWWPFILASVAGCLSGRPATQEMCRKHSLQDVTVSFQAFLLKKTQCLLQQMPHLASSCPMHRALGWYPGVAPGCCKPPSSLLPVFWDGLHGVVFSKSRLPLPASTTPSPDPGEPWGSPSGMNPTLPFLPCSFLRGRAGCTAARTLRGGSS